MILNYLIFILLLSTFASYAQLPEKCFSIDRSIVSWRSKDSATNVSTNLPNVELFKVYPNPAANTIQFLILEEYNIMISAEIYDINGLLRKKFNPTRFDGLIEWNLKDEDNIRVCSGVYILKLITDSKNYHQKFVVED
ncbi:MAG: T9SS type A sorting domain-containing protein [Candidatus Kapaibacterium sp.]